MRNWLMNDKLIIFRYHRSSVAMIVELEGGMLELIVIEEVRKLQRGLGVSRRIRTGLWFRRVLEKIDIYGGELKKRYIQVVVSDFGGARTLRVKGGKIDNEGVDSLRDFADMVKDSDDSQYKNKLKEDMRILVGEWRSGNIELETWLKMVEECHNSILWRMELMIRNTIFHNTLSRYRTSLK